MSIIIGVLFNVVGLGVFHWALFALAIQALPLFIGMTAGIYSYQTRAGPVGTVVIASAAGGFTLVLGQHSFSATRSPVVLRWLFAIPAARAGYGVTVGICAIEYSPGTVTGGVRHA